MMRSPADVKPRALARPGSWSGCLYLAGDDSRRDAPVWVCSHRNEGKAAAKVRLLLRNVHRPNRREAIMTQQPRDSTAAKDMQRYLEYARREEPDLAEADLLGLGLEGSALLDARRKRAEQRARWSKAPGERPR